MPTYLSPADSLIVDGKLYRPGDNVPLGDDLKTALEVAGHRFENSDEAEIQSATVDAQAAMMTAEPPPPMDDRGAPVEQPEARSAARTSKAANGGPAAPTAQS